MSESLARVRTCAGRVPVTRVSDLTPLDRLRLPVFSATTPLARDLTTHLGKGPDKPSAHLSAMMEAVERVSAERLDRPIRRRSFRQISQEVAAVADPRAFDLPDDSLFDEDYPVSWVEGWDLARSTAVWMAADLAITPPADGVLHSVDTNGLAAGNTLLEAAVHGLCEVIERDALGLLLFRMSFGDADERVAAGPRIALDSLPDWCGEWLARITAEGLAVEMDLLASDTGVPVFRTLLFDPAYPSMHGAHPRRFAGFGASPNAALAATRSITEAVQSRLSVVQGARDSFNLVSPSPRKSALAPALGDAESRDQVPLEAVPTFSTHDLSEDFQYLLGHLRQAGFDQVIGIDLTRQDFGVPVMRIRVPGLTSFAVNRRRIGWRCLRYLL